MADRHALQYRAEQLAGAFPALLVAAQRVAATVLQGVHGRRRVGIGETFWQFRPYEAGDPVQRIDWRESAKRERAYIRQTEWEAAQSVWLWRDSSPSMKYRSHLSLVEKDERATLLILALCALLLRGGEHVAFPEEARKYTGRNALMRAAASLAGIVARGNDGVPPPALLPRHARIALIGDFLAPLEDTARAVRALAARGVTGHLLQVLDPAEESLPFQGRTLFEGVENDGSLLVRRTEKLRGAYVARLAEHRDGLARLARGLGWTLAVHHTDRSPEAALLPLYVALAERPGL
jgi:uncharacterized protein (DUF58 family)